MRFALAVVLVLVLFSNADAASPTQFMISVTICELDSDKADAKPRILSSPTLMTTVNRPASVMVGGAIKLPKLDGISPDEMNFGTQLRILCGEPRGGKVSIDLKASQATVHGGDDREDELAVVSEQGVHLQGRIPLGVEKRVDLSRKDDPLHRYLLVKIEPVLADAAGNATPRLGPNVEVNSPSTDAEVETK